MIRNNRMQTERIEFRFHAPDAKSVSVAGSFNSWDPVRLPLRRLDNGDWRGDLKLAPGRYEYRFVADGKWFTDPGAKEAVPNPFGTRNSVLVI